MIGGFDTCLTHLSLFQRKRIQAKEEAAERRMATLIKQREKVLDKQLPKPKVTFTTPS